MPKTRIAGYRKRRGHSFNPRQLSGLKLWLATDRSDLVRGAGQASQFTAATSEYLSIADNASLSTGDIDFTIAAWVYMDSTPANEMYIAGKDAVTGNNREWGLVWNNTNNRFRLAAGNNNWSSSASIDADTFGAPSTGTWYFVMAWRDKTAATLNIAINGGATDSIAEAAATQDTAAAFTIGARGDAALFFDGRIQCVGFWKSVLTAAQRTALYNGGTPLAYDQLDPSEKDAASLISYWELNEPSGTRVDVFGTNDLTDNNTVTTAAGTVQNAVTTWTDLSGNGNNTTQATQANKPVIRIPSASVTTLGGKSVIRFDGINDSLSVGGSINIKVGCTVIVVTKVDVALDDNPFISKGIGDLAFLQWAAAPAGLAIAEAGVSAFVNEGIVGVNTAQIVTFIWDGVSPTGTGYVYRNGKQVGSGTYTTANIDNNATLFVGVDTATYFDGDIAEIIIYNRSLNDAERVRVEKYLSQKYGLSLA